MNQYPLWKNALVVVAILLGALYALPNIYPEDPAIQISGATPTVEVSRSTIEQAVAALESGGVAVKTFEVDPDGKKALIRLRDGGQQLRAKESVSAQLGDDYVAALNLAPTTPDWLSNIGGAPMSLGLDLRGGVHFLLEVDLDTALSKRMDDNRQALRDALREEKISGVKAQVDGTRVILTYRKPEQWEAAYDVLTNEFRQFSFVADPENESLGMIASLLPSAIQEIEDQAVSQNLQTIRNRVNELGVAEPLVQRQGRNRIVVQLPGVQDSALAKRVLGRTATLEFRMVADSSSGQVPLGAEVYPYKDTAQTYALERRVIASGNQVLGARQEMDPQNGGPQVAIRLDNKGGRAMQRTTSKHLKELMAVLFIETKTKTVEVMENGELIKKRVPEEHRYVINAATIQGVFASNFVITGLDSLAEAHELALLLRAGALAAPMYYVEERTVGPSLGVANIKAGFNSIMLGLGLVLIFMLVHYRVFGLIANIALAVNLLLLMATMSFLGATLTLPGIAGMVLTVGMAVDANVLIFARIREELAEGSAPHQAIFGGYSRAFVTILDANITTLLVALVLFLMGTGPIKGFAVTLSIGILTSMFTAIMVTRAIVNLVYGRRSVSKLAIG